MPPFWAQKPHPNKHSLSTLLSPSLHLEMVLYADTASELAIMTGYEDDSRERERIENTVSTLGYEMSARTPSNVEENSQMVEIEPQNMAVFAPENHQLGTASSEEQGNATNIDSNTFRALSTQILRVQIDRLRGINQQLLMTSGPSDITILSQSASVEDQSHSSVEQGRSRTLPLEAADPEEGTEPENGNDESDLSLYEELKNLYRRCHQSLPFLSLFLLHFAYQHTLGIFILVTGSLSIMGLDQRLRSQIVLKENVNTLKLFGIAAICIIDIFALACVNGDINPFRQFKMNLFLQADSFNPKSDKVAKVLFWEVIGAILVNDFIIRLLTIIVKAMVTAMTLEIWTQFMVKCQSLVKLCESSNILYRRTHTTSPDSELSRLEHETSMHDDGSSSRLSSSSPNWHVLYYRRKRKLFGIIEVVSIFIRSALAGLPWCTYYQIGSTESVADAVTFAYIFMKALVLGFQAQTIYTLIRSFVSLKLEFGTYVTEEDVVEAGSTDCSICYERMKRPVKLSCSHIFCEECVSEWLDREHSCPLCRASVRSADSSITQTNSARFPIQSRPQYLDGSTSLLPQML
uniref:Uncharacterized protein AlNc14C15G1718 n=1 Tax=Albugo laibachii Nc14 TaxID=890382 RepID=F0W431_9STRA|nr:conserved hypothetical protein [Albugo laibachii Nc14]|eukprot:CCA15828.1 conserved hypothetical protein [Albugo laibachii Nc14]